jgi:creatinine amidohydrolase
MKQQSNNKNQLNQITEFEKLNWKQITNLDISKTIFFLPISPLEEHGPHLPIGTDLLTSKDSSIEAIKRIQLKNKEIKCYLLPSIPLGYCEFNTDFPGSISVSSKVVKQIVYSYGSSLAEHGFKYLVICTYHMALGHLRGIYSAMDKLRRKYDMKVCEPWAPFFHSDKIKKSEPQIGFDTSKEVHAGFRETSLMKYQYPYLVDSSHTKLNGIYKDLKSAKYVGKKFKEVGIKEGYIGNPSKADVDYGRWFFNFTVDAIVDATLALYKGEKPIDLPSDIKSKMKLLFWQ